MAIGRTPTFGALNTTTENTMTTTETTATDTWTDELAALKARHPHPQDLAPAVSHRNAAATGIALSEGTNVHSWTLSANLRRALPHTGIEVFVPERLYWAMTNSREASTAFLRYPCFAAMPLAIS